MMGMTVRVHDQGYQGGVLSIYVDTGAAMVPGMSTPGPPFLKKKGGSLSLIYPKTTSAIVIIPRSKGIDYIIIIRGGFLNIRRRLKMDPRPHWFLSANPVSLQTGANLLLVQRGMGKVPMREHIENEHVTIALYNIRGMNK